MTWTVPALADCAPDIEPVEYQCLVAMSEFSERTAGGILLTEETKDREAYKASTARLVAVSPLAFTYAEDTAWKLAQPRVGDVVFVGKYPGDEIEGRDGRKYRLIGDRQVGAVMERGSNSRPVADLTEAEIVQRFDRFIHEKEPADAG